MDSFRIKRFNSGDNESHLFEKTLITNVNNEFDFQASSNSLYKSVFELLDKKSKFNNSDTEYSGCSSEYSFILNSVSRIKNKL